VLKFLEKPNSPPLLGILILSHRTSSSSVGHRFVVVQVRPLASLRQKQPNPQAANSKTLDIALMKKAYLAGVDEEDVVDSSYRALRRPIVCCVVLSRAKLVKEDARSFSYYAKLWRHEGKPREGRGFA